MDSLAAWTALKRLLNLNVRIKAVSPNGSLSLRANLAVSTLTILGVGISLERKADSPSY